MNSIVTCLIAQVQNFYVDSGKFVFVKWRDFLSSNNIYIINITLTIRKVENLPFDITETNWQEILVDMTLISIIEDGEYDDPLETFLQVFQHFNRYNIES